MTRFCIEADGDQYHARMTTGCGSLEQAERHWHHLDAIGKNPGPIRHTKDVGGHWREGAVAKHMRSKREAV